MASQGFPSLAAYFFFISLTFPCWVDCVKDRWSPSIGNVRKCKRKMFLSLVPSMGISFLGYAHMLGTPRERNISLKDEISRFRDKIPDWFPATLTSQVLDTNRDHGNLAACRQDVFRSLLPGYHGISSFPRLILSLHLQDLVPGPYFFLLLVGPGTDLWRFRKGQILSIRLLYRHLLHLLSFIMVPVHNLRKESVSLGSFPWDRVTDSWHQRSSCLSMYAGPLSSLCPIGKDTCLIPSLDGFPGTSHYT
jgi:hypothetical protein